MAMWGEMLNGKTVQEHLDDEHKPLKSAYIDGIYYAAVVDIQNDGAKKVFGLIISVYEDEEEEDMNHFKIMTEEEGPVAPACPVEIIDLLTPTDDPCAVEWRARCRQFAVDGVVPPLGGMEVMTEPYLLN